MSIMRQYYGGNEVWNLKMEIAMKGMNEYFEEIQQAISDSTTAEEALDISNKLLEVDQFINKMRHEMNPWNKDNMTHYLENQLEAWQCKALELANDAEAVATCNREEEDAPSFEDETRKDFYATR